MIAFVLCCCLILFFCVVHICLQRIPSLYPMFYQYCVDILTFSSFNLNVSFYVSAGGIVFSIPSSSSRSIPLHLLARTIVIESLGNDFRKVQIESSSTMIYPEHGAILRPPGPKMLEYVLFFVFFFFCCCCCCLPVMLEWMTSSAGMAH